MTEAKEEKEDKEKIQYKNLRKKNRNRKKIYVKTRLGRKKYEKNI